MTAPAPHSTSAAYRQALAALHQQQRAQLQLLIQQIDASLAADWQRGPGAAAEFFQPLLDAYAKALADLRALNDDPAATLDLSWLTSHNAQLQSIEASVRASMINYGQQAAKTVEDAQVAMLARGESDAEALVQEALNPAWELGVNPAMLWDRPNPNAIAQWLGRAGNGHPLGDLFANFDREAAAAARQAILSGLATGANPMTILNALQQALGISRSRALTISRSELLGSYRAAAHETYRANSDVLNGWLWSAGGNNPCAMCMGMDGTLHGLEESLDDHPCGKCAPLPVTKPWDDILGPLGIDTSDMAETSLGAEGNYTPMSERFDDFSPERQRAIIGTQTGYDAYLRGEVTLKDFIGVRPGSDGFPSSYYQRSLKELQIPTRQARRLVEPSQEILEKYRLGTLRYTDFGQITPDALMPAWAKASDESRIVYQILRNGLPYDMSSHEQGLLITNLEQMLRGELPTNVRAAAERQLQALGQTVERTTVGQAAKDLAEASLREAQATAQELTISAEHAVVERSAVTLTGDDLRAQAQELRALVRPEMSSDVATIAAQQEAKAALLRDNPDWQHFVDRLEREGIVDNYIYAGHTFTPEMQAVDYIERAWAKTPLYRDPMNIALRDVARDVFGLQVPSREVPQMLADEAAHIVEQDGAALRAYVQATYEQTQRWFEDRGISEITVFRGSTSDVAQIGLPYSGNAVNKIVEGSSLSSFTSDPEHALEFARSKTGEEYNALIAERVLVSQVFGVPDTSMARQQESEFILFGSARDAAVFSWKGANAPDLAKALDELASELAQVSVQE